MMINYITEAIYNNTIQDPGEVHIYNTQCSMGVDSKTMEYDIENISIAEFFVKNVISKTVKILTTKLNISTVENYLFLESKLPPKDSIHVMSAKRMFLMENT